VRSKIPTLKIPTGQNPDTQNPEIQNPDRVKIPTGSKSRQVKIPTGQNPDMYEILKNWPAQQFSLVAPDNLPSLSFNAARN
jgi:hypothetical protein